MADKTNVFVIDDHPLVRDSLSMLINQQDDMHVCGEAEDMASALKGDWTKLAALPNARAI